MSSTTQDLPPILAQALAALPPDAPGMQIAHDGTLSFKGVQGFSFRFRLAKSLFIAQVRPAGADGKLSLHLTCLVGMIPFTSENPQGRAEVLAAITALKSQGLEQQGTFKISPRQELYFEEDHHLDPPHRDTRVVALACAVVLRHLPALRALGPLVIDPQMYHQPS